MLAHVYRQANRALRVHGVFGSMKIAWEKTRHQPPQGPSVYDQQNGVVTDGNEDLSALTIVGARKPSPLENRYQPTAESIVREMFEAQALHYKTSTFIEVGSGKGRVVLVASEYPFRKIIGIEFAHELHQTAVANLAAYQSPTQKCHDIDLVWADATTFRLPPTPTVVFMASPFHGPIMAAFIKNVEDSLRAHPRPFFVLYRQPKEAHLWDASRAFRRVAHSPLYVNYRAV